ncbi:MAG: anti-sigma factor [Xenococcus sp. (in: cyanobacteria)]
MKNNYEPYNLEELLAGYVLGNLDEQELTWFNKKLAANPQLQQEINELETTLTLMPYSLPQNVPSSDLRSKICQKSADSNQAKYGYTFKLNRLAWIISGITAVTSLLLGVNNYGLRQELATNYKQLGQQQELITMLRQPHNRLVSLQGLDELPTASGSLFVAPQKKKAVLALQNLAPLSGNKVYRLWAISPEKTTGCANFIPNEQGIVHLEFSNNALQDADSVLITVEPKADTKQPQGSPIMNGYFEL